MIKPRNLCEFDFALKINNSYLVAYRSKYPFGDFDQISNRVSPEKHEVTQVTKLGRII